jgi:ribosomal protein S18 acetylase RimI-like enzyme
VAFRIRQFQKADFDTLWHIDQACFDPQLAYSRPEMAFYMRRPGAFTLVAEAGENGAPRSPAEGATEGAGNTDPAPRNSPAIVGFIVAEVRWRTGHIITIDVVAEARRSGVGSALLVAAEDRLRNSGAETVALETAINNEPAIRFYKRKGYSVEKMLRGYYAHQLDALVMGKALSTAG